jgi:hypothetical protein
MVSGHHATGHRPPETEKNETGGRRRGKEKKGSFNLKGNKGRGEFPLT